MILIDRELIHRVLAHDYGCATNQTGLATQDRLEVCLHQQDRAAGHSLDLLNPCRGASFICMARTGESRPCEHESDHGSDQSYIRLSARISDLSCGEKDRWDGRRRRWLMVSPGGSRKKTLSFLMGRSLQSQSIFVAVTGFVWTWKRCR